MRSWVAILPLTAVMAGCQRAPTKSELPDAMVLLRQSRDAMFALKSYSAICFTTTTLDNKSKPPLYVVSTLVAEKPAKMSYHAWEVPKLPDPKLPLKPPANQSAIFISNGTKEIKHIGGFGTDTVIDKVDPSQLNTLEEPWNGFFARNNSILNDIDQARARGEVGDASYLNSEMVDGVQCDKLLVHIVSTQAGSKSDESLTYLIGHDDHLVRQLTSHISFNERPGLLRDAALHNGMANLQVDEHAFSASTNSILKEIH